MMNIFGFHDIPPKHIAIIVVAAMQIVFGIVTLIFNEDIFNSMLEKVKKQKLYINLDSLFFSN